MDETENQKRPSTISKNKKKQSPIVIVCGIVLGLFLLLASPILIIEYLTNDYYHGSMATGPAVVDYLKYLENKYGRDEGFYYVETNGNDCPMFNAGFCKRKFSSKILDGKTFEVRYQKTAQSDYTDQYWLIRYQPQFDAYYRELFSTVIPYGYSLEFTGTLDDQNVSNLSFEKLLSNKNAVIDIKILTSYEEIPDIASIDLESIKAQISDIASISTTPKIDRVELSINMEGSNLTGSCPNMATTSDGSGGPLLECSAILYKNSTNNY